MKMSKRNQNDKRILPPDVRRGGFVISIFVLALLFFIISAAVFFVVGNQSFSSKTFEYSKKTVGQVIAPTEEIKKIEHLKTPETVKGIYMTSWVAGMKNWRAELIKFIDSTELNAVIIDVKDYSGRIAFKTDDPELTLIGSPENRVSDIKELIEELHGHNIYAIARISVFQDAFLSKNRPDLAVKNEQGGVWKDYKGVSWLDPASAEVWDYIIKVSKEAEKAGFDELNFDYIRFPSDGNMENIKYDYWDEKKPKADALEEFFIYLRTNLDDLGVPLSVDLFGMTTIHTNDLNIGQIMEKAVPYFDYISPMVYPSHYPPGFNGYKNPADHPYEIIFDGLVQAKERLIAASSSPFKLRPWLQDFDLGAVYDASMVRKEKQAVYDAGLNSWLIWDPANKYTRGAYEKK